MELQRPDRSKHYPAKLILEVNKSILVAEALINRKSTFLERKEWVSVYGPYQPRASHILRLWDLTATLPGITEEIFGFERKTSLGVLKPGDCEETRMKLVNLETEITAWYASWAGDLHQRHIEVPASAGSRISSDNNGALFETLLHYEYLERQCLHPARCSHNCDLGVDAEDRRSVAGFSPRL